ncbi:MAG: ComEC family competence protein [Candidatus Omnitrophica bacterium]|nr:ComEC family competence protein [Candidatus Omnitrophota bacterium]
MKRPLVGVCLFFCLGILVANYTNIPFSFFWLVAFSILVFSCIFLRKKLISDILVYCAVFFIGAAVFENSQILPTNHINKYLHYKGRVVSLKGVVYTSPIDQRVYFGKKKSFELSVEEIKLRDTWRKVRGKILVNLYQEKELFYADELILEGKLYRVPNFNISEKFNYRKHLKRKGIYGILSIGKTGKVVVIAKKYANPVKQLAYKTKEALKSKIYKYMPDLEAKILKAIILGERQDIPKNLNSIFIQTGTAHILAISGLHIGIIAFIILVLLKVFRIPRKPRYMLIILFLIIYTFITGARVSVIRSALMIAIILLGILFEREANIYNSLSFAALLILAYNPNQLFAIGFQLSFLSVISIFYFGYKIQDFLFKIIHTNSKIAKAAIRSFSISSGIWLGILGVIAFYFNIIAPVTVLANLFVIPLITIIIALSFSVILSGFVLPFLAPFFAVTTKVSISILIRLIYSFSKAPGAYFYIKDFSIFWLLVYYSVTIGLFNIERLLKLTKLTRYDKLR